MMPLGDLIQRRVMFALDLVDPITRQTVTRGLHVTAAGFSPPVATASGRFVWRDVDPPAARTVTVKIVSQDGQYADDEKTLTIPAHAPGADLVRRIDLTPTGLYTPPTGLLAAAGMVVDVAAPPRVPMAGLAVRLQYRNALSLGNETGSVVARTDARGGFVAALPDLADPATTAMVTHGVLVGWLSVTQGANPPRFTGLLPLRPGRLLRIADPLVWAALSQTPP